MDPTSVADPVIEKEFGYMSNKHLYDWITEREANNEQYQLFMKEVDREYASKQAAVEKRKQQNAEIYDSFERIMEARIEKVALEEGRVWREDYEREEVAPSYKLDNPDWETLVGWVG